MNYINNLGEFSSIANVWKEYPHGGKEGDYVVVNGKQIAWNKYTSNWGEDPKMPGVNDEVDSDFLVKGDLRVGGKIINKDLQRIKESTVLNKGYFKTVDGLKKSYPTATSGSKAYVGSNYPYAIYLWDVVTSAWVDSGEAGGGEDVNLGDYYTKAEVTAELQDIQYFVGKITRSQLAKHTFAAPYQTRDVSQPLSVGQRLSLVFTSANNTCQLTIQIKNGDATIATLVNTLNAEKTTIIDYDVVEDSDIIRIYSSANGSLTIYEYAESEETIPEQIEALKESVDTSIDSLHGNFFTEEGKYIDPSGNFYTASSASVATGYIPIANVDNIKVRGRSGPYVALLAFYDENKAFISSIYGNNYNNVLVEVTKDEFPANAAYFRATGNNNSSDVLTFASLRYLYGKKQEVDTGIGINTVATMGASLMYNGNGWVEKGCEIISAACINKAVSGERPPYYANLLYNEAYCTDEQFENIDVLAIQFSNAGNVYIEDNHLSIEEYEDMIDTGLSNPFNALSDAQCLDYILKKWQKKCYTQKNNANSQWYGTQFGKPCNFLFVTHWHDARISYNESIRKVASKWGGGVCEFDTRIGFSRNQPMYDGTQVSVTYAVDTEIIGNVVYGWHPLRNADGQKHIQKKMANIFAQALIELNSMK